MAMSDNAELRRKSTGAGWVQIYREPVSIDEAEPFAMLYRRRTRVVYGTAELVVSTAGRMRQDMPGKTVQGEYMPLGFGDTGQRYYETMVFDSNNPGQPIVTGINCSIEWVDDTSDRLANNQHEAAVSWAEEAITTGMYEVAE
jgi:hypothetical protein